MQFDDQTERKLTVTLWQEAGDVAPRVVSLHSKDASASCRMTFVKSAAVEDVFVPALAREINALADDVGEAPRTMVYPDWSFHHLLAHFRGVRVSASKTQNDHHQIIMYFSQLEGPTDVVLRNPNVLFSVADRQVDLVASIRSDIVQPLLDLSAKVKAVPSGSEDLPSDEVADVATFARALRKKTAQLVATIQNSD